MKAVINTHPLTPSGRLLNNSPSVYDTIAYSRTSQTSIKGLNERPSTGEPPRLSFGSETSLHDFRDPVTRKNTKTGFKITTEADVLDEETPAVSRRRAPTKVPINTAPSAFKSVQIHKSALMTQSSLGKSSFKRSETNEKVLTPGKKKNTVIIPENIPVNKKDILESPFKLEKMFPQKAGLIRKRRKSCHCEWCGGMSNLEKKLSRNPLLAVSPRRRKKNKKDEPVKEEEPISVGDRASKSSLGGSKGKSKTGRNTPKIKSLFHSKTLGAQKLAAVISFMKPLNPADVRPQSIEGESRSRKSIGEGICSWKDNKDGFEEEKIDFTRNASLVIEQEEDEVQNVSLEDLHDARSKKKGHKKGKKSISQNMKLEIKMRKISAPSSGLMSPMNKRGSQRRSTLKMCSPVKKEFKINPGDDKTLKALGFGEERYKNKAPDSPNKFSWDKFTNQASDIINIYSQRQTLSPHVSSMSRTVTDPQAPTGKTKFSVFSAYKGPSTSLNRKQVSEPSFVIRSSLPKWDLSIKRDSMQECTEKDIIAKYANLSVRSVTEALCSPISRVSRQGNRQKEKKTKQIYTIRNDKSAK